jgi:hypothetical protein
LVQEEYRGEKACDRRHDNDDSEENENGGRIQKKKVAVLFLSPQVIFQKITVSQT